MKLTSPLLRTFGAFLTLQADNEREPVSARQIAAAGGSSVKANIVGRHMRELEKRKWAERQTIRGTAYWTVIDS